MKIIAPSGKVDDYFIKAAEKMIRPTSSGEQSYDQNKSTWPLGQPIKKIESDAQCAGMCSCMYLTIITYYKKYCKTSTDFLTG